MIIKIEHKDIQGIADINISDFISDVMDHSHYIDCDGEVRNLLVESVNRNGSVTQKQRLNKFKGFDVTDELKRFLSTVPFSSYSLQELKLLIQKPARILMENLREWPIYQDMIGCYKRDRLFTNLFQLLERSKCAGDLLGLQAGGKPELVPVFNSYNEGEYKNVANRKICLVFDRDTNDEMSFSENSNRLFELLCGKKYTEMENNDVFSLSQGKYVWHMWYRREIENYFPSSQFSVLGYSLIIPKDEDSYYKKVGDKYTKPNGAKFAKDDVPKLVNGMDRSKYEVGLSTFTLNNGTIVNEIQLFLLKLVKII